GQCERTSAPMVPHLVQTTRGPNGGTVIHQWLRTRRRRLPAFSMSCLHAGDSEFTLRARHAWTSSRSGISSGQWSWASGSHALRSASVWANAGHDATMNAIANGARNSLVCKDIGAPLSSVLKSCLGSLSEYDKDVTIAAGAYRGPGGVGTGHTVSGPDAAPRRAVRVLGCRAHPGAQLPPLPSSSGNRATLTAIRRASSLVSTLACE